MSALTSELTPLDIGIWKAIGFAENLEIRNLETLFPYHDKEIYVSSCDGNYGMALGTFSKWLWPEGKEKISFRNIHNDIKEYWVDVRGIRKLENKIREKKLNLFLDPSLPMGSVSEKIHSWSMAFAFLSKHPCLLNGIPKEERAELLSIGGSALLAIKGEYTRKACLEAIAKRPKKERERFAAAFLPIFKGVQDLILGDSDRRVKAYLWAIDGVPINALQQMLSAITALLESISEEELVCVCETLHKEVPLEARASVFAVMQLALQGLFTSEYRAIDCIIKAILRIPPGERSSTLTAVSPLFKDVLRATERARIIYAIADIPAVEQTAFIDALSPFLKNKDITIDNILDIIDAFPLEERTEFVTIIKLFLQEDQSKSKKQEILEIIAQLAPFLAPSCRMVAITLARDSGYRYIGTIFEFIFSSNEILEASQAYLLECLLSEKWPPEKKFELATKMCDNYKKLSLYEGHPLFEEMIRTRVICAPQALKSCNNPYTVYNNIKKAFDSEKPIDIPLEMFTIAGKTVSWHLRGLQARNRCYSIQELPEEVTLTTIPTLFKALEKRFKSLQQSRQEQLETFVSKRYEKSLLHLKINLLHNDVINSALAINRRTNAQVPTTTFYLFNILHTILKAETTVLSEEQPLTQQEEMLLGFSQILQNCPTGQKSGIALYYADMTSSKHSNVIEKSSCYKFEEMITTCIQNLLRRTLHNQELVRELNGGRISQGSHITGYLQNRTYWHIGLPHVPDFDPYTGFLDISLVEMKIENLVATIFKHCPPLKAIEQIASIIKSAWSGKTNPFYQAVAELLGQPPEDSSVEECLTYFNSYITFEEVEDDIPIPRALTPSGVLRILVAMNYLQLIA